MGGSPVAERHCAAPTTQGPAGHTGRGVRPINSAAVRDRTNACFTSKVEWKVERYGTYIFVNLTDKFLTVEGPPQGVATKGKLNDR
jgi:hypothetical protein